MGTEAKRLAQFADAADAAAKQFPRFKELAQRARVEAVNAKMDSLMEKDSDISDDTIVEETTRPNDREPAKHEPQDENEKSDEELDREAEKIAREIERRRRAKQRKDSTPEDTSSSPSETLDADEAEPEGRGDHAYRTNARYRQQVDANVEFVLRAAAKATGQAPPKATTEPNELLEVAQDLPYARRVEAMVNFVVACDRRRRGEI